MSRCALSYAPLNTAKCIGTPWFRRYEKRSGTLLSQHSDQTSRLLFFTVIGRPLFCFHHQNPRFRPKSPFFDDIVRFLTTCVGKNDRGAFESRIVPFRDDSSHMYRHRDFGLFSAI